MMLTKVDMVDGGLMGIGLAVSLQDMQAIASVIIIIIDLLWLVGKFVIKFMRYYSDGVLSDDEVDDLIKTKDEIQHLTDKIKEDDKHE